MYTLDDSIEEKIKALIEQDVEQNVELGGEGSGNKRHAGIIGHQGGSLPKGMSSHSSAVEKIKTIKEFEPDVTQEVQDLAKEFDGQLQGMDFRFKDPDSMARQIEGKMEKDGLSIEDATGEVTDGLRYTMLFPPETFTEKTKAVEAALIKKGWKLRDHLNRNFFGPDSVYEGYSSVWEDDQGRIFEMQFHTPVSVAIRERNHKLYEIWRVSKSSRERDRLANEMQAAWSDPAYVRPLNYQELGIGGDV